MNLLNLDFFLFLLSFSNMFEPFLYYVGRSSKLFFAQSYAIFINIRLFRQFCRVFWNFKEHSSNRFKLNSAYFIIQFCFIVVIENQYKRCNFYWMHYLWSLSKLRYKYHLLNILPIFQPFQFFCDVPLFLICWIVSFLWQIWKSSVNLHENRLFCRWAPEWAWFPKIGEAYTLPCSVRDTF